MKMMVSAPSENDGRSFVPVTLENLIGQVQPGQYVQRSQLPSGFSESFDPNWVAPEYVPSPVIVDAPAAPAKTVVPVISFDDLRKRQRYAESGFDDRAVSKAGAKGAFQIMPSVLSDYIAATGKKGDLFDYEYNKSVRDWYVDWLMNRPVVNGNGNKQSDVNTLAKMAAAYNWGVGNLTDYLVALKNKGVDIYNSTDWVEGLNPETRDYVKFVALQQDTTGPRTTEAFNKAMAKYNLASDGGRIKALARRIIDGGYEYAGGGRLFRNGGQNSGWNIGATILKKAKEKYQKAKEKYLSDYADKGYVYSYPSNPFELFGYVISPYARTSEYGDYMLDVMPKNITDARRALFAKNFGVNSNGKGYENAIVESRYRPTVSSNPDAKYYTLPIDDPKARFEDLQSIIGTGKYDFGEDENGKYISVYDKWDLAPITDKGSDFLNATPPEIYDRFYQSDVPEIYNTYSNPNFDSVVGSTSGMDFSSGGKIHIKPSKRGTFKVQATKMGMGVKQAAHHILAHKDNYSSAMVKKANFAANFADEGGQLQKEKVDIAGLVKRINETSNADFVKRLLDKRRKTLKNDDGTVSTHEMSYVTDGDSAIVFPNVQSVRRKLKRFDYPESLDRAISRGDTLHMGIPEAEAFTTEYKNYYPGFDRYSSGGTLLRPYNEFRRGGPKGGIVKKVSDYTSGLLTPEEVSIILRHPTNFSKHLNWDKAKVDSLKMSLYNNKAPYGYDVDSAIKAVTDPSSGRTSDTSMDDNTEAARDYMYAEYLGIPENKRRHPEAKSLYEESAYRPSIGSVNDNKYVRFSDEGMRNTAVDIYNDLIFGALSGSRNGIIKPKKYYDTEHNGSPYLITVGPSGSNFIVSAHGEYDYDNDPYSAVLANYVLGSGVDPNRGQYVSVYDKWDLNPSSGMYKLPNSVIKEFQSIGDASGGFGNPVNYYDRIYLDDYYGIDTTPQGGAYYGGYIPEIKVVGSKDTTKKK